MNKLPKCIISFFIFLKSIKLAIVELCAKNKIAFIFFIFAALMTALFFMAAAIALYNLNSCEIYKQRLNDKINYSKNLENEYKVLQKKYEDLKQDNISPKKYVDWSKIDTSNIKPQTSSNDYFEPSQTINKPSYIPEQKNNLPQYNYEAEQKERDLIRIENTIQQVKEQAAFEQLFPNSKNPYRIY